MSATNEPGSAPADPARLDATITRTVRPDVRAMKAYVVQPSPPGTIKLDAMENPFALPPELQHELGERLGRVAINRYPGESLQRLRELLARQVGVPEGCGLILGNGSDELITLIGVACDQPGASVLAPAPTFVMYEMSARLQGLDFASVPMKADFSLDEPAMMAAIERHQPAVVYLAYPNNPTANLYVEAAVDRIVRAAPGLVVIDEAYQPFSSRSYLSRIGRAGYEHVLLMRTLSKFGLAGVRLGYLIGPSALVDEIDKVRPPYNVSVLNAEAALFALEHMDEFERQAAVLREERSRLADRLGRIAGIEVFPSEANMILVRVARPTELFEALKRRNVLIKNVSSAHPLLAGCIRLTVGTPQENDRMIEALEENLP